MQCHKSGCALASVIAACLLLSACGGGGLQPSPSTVSAPPPAPPPPPPSPVLDGAVIDVPVAHNALVYDSVRNVYYASVPGSVIGNGNRIATIEPVTGQVSYSASVGSEPNALALAADASVLYVGLDGAGEVAKLALPSMRGLGGVKLIIDPALGQSHAETITVSPADATVVAVSMAWSSSSPRHAGVALIRDLVMQPKRTQVHTGSNLVAFDGAGTKVYGLNIETDLGLRRIQVLADGLVQELVVPAGTGFSARTLSFADNRVIAGHALHNAPDLTADGVISGPSDCVRQRAGTLLLCSGNPDFSTGEARLLIADSGTFVIKASLLYSAGEPVGVVRKLVEGPAGQIAISYETRFPASVSRIRLFSSAQLLTPPTPPAVVWPVTSSSTVDGQALDVGITHNALVYDSVRNVYYASVPGSVIGSGNSIAVIDPSTGQVTHSAPIGSEPHALALAADASTLYVGLDGSGEVVKLALPSMAELGRVRLLVSSFFDQSRPLAIAVSPVDPSVAAVSMSSYFGTALLRDMVIQPQRTAFDTNNTVLAFDSTGGTLYGLDDATLRHMQVLADGVSEQASVAVSGWNASLAFANNRVTAGRTLYDAPTLTPAGSISGASDCSPQRSGTELLCLGDSSAPGRVLLASSTTFVIGASLVYATSDQYSPKRLVQGPAGQIAVDDTWSYFSAPAPKVRLFSSSQLP